MPPRGSHFDSSLLSQSLNTMRMHQDDSAQDAKGNLKVRASNSDVSPPGGDFGKAKSQPPVFEDTNFTILHVNVGNNRGFLKTRAELEAHLLLLTVESSFSMITMKTHSLPHSTVPPEPKSGGTNGRLARAGAPR